jgi:hypothetical protein
METLKKVAGIRKVKGTIGEIKDRVRVQVKGTKVEVQVKDFGEGQANIREVKDKAKDYH